MRLKAKALSALDRSPRSERQAAFTRETSLRADATRAPSHRTTRLALLAGISALALLAFASSAHASRAYESSFGTFSGASPQALTVDQSNGDVYAINFNNNTLDRFDSTGAPKNYTAGPGSGTNQLPVPSLSSVDNRLAAVAVDRSGGPADGNIYVADGAGAIEVFAGDGAPLTTLTGSGTPGGAFQFACGVAVDQNNGDVYIGDFLSSAVFRYSPAAATVAEADYSGGIATAITPCGVAVANGRVYAGDTYSRLEVDRYKASDFATGPLPTPAGVLVNSNAPTAIAVDPLTGDLYVDEGPRVAVHDATGTPRYTFTTAGLVASAGVAVRGPAGKAYVSNPVTNKIDVYGAPPTASRAYESSFGTFSGASPQALTVDQSNGDVYAINFNNNTLDRFDSTGAPKNYTAGPGSGTNQLPVPSLSSVDNRLAAVAVDRSGGPADGNIYVADGAGAIEVFAGDGAPLTTLTGSGTPGGAFQFACGVAVDQNNGDVYIGDFLSSAVFRYSPAAATVAEADYSGGIATAITPCGVAVANGRVYAGDTYSRLEVDRYKASDFATGPLPTPAGVLVNSNAPTAIAVDPLTGDLYVDEGPRVAVHDATGTPRYTFTTAGLVASAGVAVRGPAGKAYVSNPVTNKIDVYGPEINGHDLTVLKPGPGSGTVTSTPPGINCGPVCSAAFGDGAPITLTATPDPGSGFKGWTGCDTTAGNDCTITLDGADAEVSAIFSAAPLVSAPNADQIGTTDARLRGSVNPAGEATTFHFDYGTDTGYGQQTPESSSIGSDIAPQQVSRIISGLAPGTTYHFRLVATNSLGTTEGPDQTFSTYALDPDFSGDDCDNGTFRTGPSAKLPDCRAYEQASPVSKNGADIQGDLGATQAASDGSRITFWTQAGIPGAVGAQAPFPTFLASRGASDWSTAGIVPPADLGNAARILGWTPDLKQTFASVGEAGQTSKALVARQSDTGANLFVHPVLSGQDSIAGASSDGSAVYFEHDGAPLAPGAAPGKYNLYAWDRETGDVVLAGVLPGGTPPPDGSFAGPYDWAPGDPNPQHLTHGGASFNYHTQDTRAVSADGGRAFFTESGTGQLYLRENALDPGATTTHVSASQASTPDPLGSQPAAFQAASSDGARAFFTSPEELTDDANTGPPATLPSIGAASLDGSNPNPGFISPRDANAIAVGAGHIYWIDTAADSIGRANGDGSGPDSTFITGADNPRDVVVDPDTDGVGPDEGYIYWTNGSDDQPGTGSIGRAQIDSAGDLVGPPDHSFITGAYAPRGIDADASYLYWVNSENGLKGNGDLTPNGTIARANLDGSGVNQSFFDDGPADQGLAVDATHIYYSLQSASADLIRRTAVDGSGSWQGIAVSQTDPDDPSGNQESIHREAPQIAIDGTNLFWTSPFDAGVNRTNLDGTDPVTKILADSPRTKGVAIDGSTLYWSSLSPTDGANPGNDLYLFDADSGDLDDLTALDDPAQPDGADVQGVVGTADDGSSVFFVANGDLDGAGEALPGTCNRTGSGFYNSYTGECSLYAWVDGNVTFVARLVVGGETSTSDAANWQPTPRAGSSYQMPTGRVAADGSAILFRSQRELGAAPHLDPQFYRWTAADGLACVTCNPSGGLTGGTPSLHSIISSGPTRFAGGIASLSRNFSPDGRRVIFETTAKLLAGDANGDGGCPVIGNGQPRCQDVYEWEAEGTGSCQQSFAHGGCLYLLSTGASDAASYFGDASETGDDAFILTRSRLVPQDRDALVDIYDARIGGGLASQHATEPDPCEVDGCQDDPPPPPTSPGSGSSTNSGPGNQGKDRSPAPTGTTKKAKKCKKGKKGRKCRKARKRNRSATTNRGGSK